MKRIALLVTAALLVFSFGQVFANSVTIDDVDGVWPSDPGKMNPGAVGWYVRLAVTGGGGATTVTGSTNGFRVFMSTTGDGTGEYNGTFGPLTIDQPFTEAVWQPLFDGGRFYNHFSQDGAGADTIGYGNFKIFGPGMVVGFDEVTFHFTSAANAGEEGNYLCLDSSYYPPGGAWLWSFDVGSVQPTWQGPFCYLIETIPNLCPVVTNAPVALSGDHCALMTYDFDATDNEGDPISYTASLGSIDGSGNWSYQPTAMDVYNSPLTLTIGVGDPINGADCNTYDVELTFTNVAPSITCPDVTPVAKGQSKTVGVTAASGDCDPIFFFLGGHTGAGTASVDPVNGDVTYNSTEGECGTVVYVTVCVTDGLDTVCCDAGFDVLCVEPFEVQIEKTHNTLQGMHELVCVTLNKGSEPIWGFDFLIAYDATGLAFQTAIEGDIYALCGWEYFTYRYGAYGNCGNACPSGLLRVVGLAETNNGPNHPDCFQWDPKPITLFCLDFLVTNDRTFECQYLPVRFFWMDCGDNTISFHESADTEHPYSQKLAISRYVYDIGCNTGPRRIDDPLYGFPGYFGAPDVCLEGDKDVPVRFIDFYNGGVDIVCADSIDARGDINLNGIANEIADVVLYTNYFVYGVGVLTPNYQAKVAASDVNADGIPLSVADLVYQIRIVVGDALPYPKVAPVAANLLDNRGVLSIDKAMGAAAVVIDGHASPELLADNMDMEYAYDADANVTRVLVYSMEIGQAFQGEFLNANGNVISVELATYEGAPVSAKPVPASFELAQNYPNPFNPATTVAFTVPQATSYTLTVYNVTGQEVEKISGTAQVGLNEVVLDGSSWSSGIYFYNLMTDFNSATKKMVLVK